MHFIASSDETLTNILIKNLDLNSQLESVTAMTARQLRVSESKLSGIDRELESARREIETLRTSAESSSASFGTETENSFRKISELEEKLLKLGEEYQRLTQEIVRCSSKDSVEQLVIFSI